MLEHEVMQDRVCENSTCHLILFHSQINNAYSDFHPLISFDLSGWLTERMQPENVQQPDWGTVVCVSNSSLGQERVGLGIAEQRNSETSSVHERVIH